MSSGILQVQPTAAPAPGGGAPPGTLAKADHAPPAPQRVAGEAFNADAAMQQALKELGLPHDESALPSAEGAPGMEDAPVPDGELAPGLADAPPAQTQTQQQKPKEEPVTQDRLSKGFAKLKRMEDSFEAKQQQHQQSLQAFQQEKQAFETERTNWNAQREAGKKDPIALLESHGWSVDHFVKYVMEDGKVPQDVLARQLADEQRATLESTKKEIEDLKTQKQREEDHRLSIVFEERVEGRVEELLGKDDAFLETAQAEFPMVLKVIDTFGRSEMLVDVRSALTKHFEQTGQAVDPQAALRYLEKAYRQRFPKMAAELGRNPAQPRAVQSAASVAQAKTPVQLTTSDRSDLSTPSEDELENMTPDEREERALRLFRGH